MGLRFNREANVREGRDGRIFNSNTLFILDMGKCQLSI